MNHHFQSRSVDHCRKMLRFVLIAAVVSSGCNRAPDVADEDIAQPAPSQERVAVWPPDDRQSDQFVGSQQCRECHAELYDRYQQHPMADSLKLASDVDIPQLDEPVTFEAGGRTYTSHLDQQQQQLVHSESLFTPDGQKVYSQSVPVHFAIGSGTRGYSFVTNRDGLLYQSPLTWYSQDQVWGLSPGYDPETHPRFERRIGDGCLACHSGRALPVRGGFHRFQADVFAEKVIGCERCHGPGAEHVEFHRQPNSMASDPIVNPAKLSAPARDSVCYQCHLHGVSRILRTDRSEFDFRPGDLISDLWVVFTQHESVDRTGQTTAVSQVEQMLSSRCYQAAAGEMSCVSCHDPHSVPEKRNKVVFYRQRCLNCHSTSTNSCSLPEPTRRLTSAADSCIECHMPALAANDVPHTSQTDHRILKQPRTAAAEASSPSGGVELFEAQRFPINDAEVQRAFALLVSADAANSSSRSVRQNALQQFNSATAVNSPDAQLIDGLSQLLLGLDDQQALSLALAGLKLAPEHESLLETAIIACERTRDVEAALQFTEQFLNLNPHHSAVLQRQAALYSALGQHEKCIASAQAALEQNPQLPLARELLIQSATQLGQLEVAREHQAILQQLQQAEQRAE